VAESLSDHAPDGIDVFFDNVGGDHLEAGLAAMNDFGRVIICGAIAAYNSPNPPPGPRNLHNIFMRALTVKGFRNYDYGEHFPRFLDEVGPLVREGAIVHRENIVEGIEFTPAAFAAMLRGDVFGKTLVHVA
jgi:NADPH-dependent curcumin reductase CurA